MRREGRQTCYRPVSSMSKLVLVRMVENMTKSRRVLLINRIPDTPPEKEKLLLHRKYGRAILPSPWESDWRAQQRTWCCLGSDNRKSEDGRAVRTTPRHTRWTASSSMSNGSGVTSLSKTTQTSLTRCRFLNHVFVLDSANISPSEKTMRIMVSSLNIWEFAIICFPTTCIMATLDGRHTQQPT